MTYSWRISPRPISSNPWGFSHTLIGVTGKGLLTFCWHNVNYDCLKHFTGSCIKPTAKQINSLPNVIYICYPFQLFLKCCLIWTSIAPAVVSCLLFSLLLWSLNSVSFLWLRLGRNSPCSLSSQTTARLVSRQQRGETSSLHCILRVHVCGRCCSVNTGL